MSRPPRARRLRSDLRRMLGDGLSFSFMVGVGESFVPAFALALGFGAVTAGLVVTLPMLVGAVLQLVSPATVGLLGSHKRWVVLCAALQALSFLPLLAGALAEAMPLALLYLAVSLYWGLGMATGPAWNTWVATLVPRRIRARYFAQRARWSQLTLLTGMAVGGLLLEAGHRQGAPVQVYALVFGAALLSRAASASFLALQSEPTPVPLGETRISPAAMRRHLREGGHGRLLVYLVVLQAAVWIAAPYFAPYMLGPLGLGYAQFAVLTGIAFLARAAALPGLGRLAHHRGTRWLLWLGSLGIVPLPALWLVSDSVAWLALLQVAGGCAWAAFELATLLSFFEHIPPHSRTSVLSVYNLAHASAVAVGAAIGALIMAGSEAPPYALLLLLSSGARLLSLVLLRGAPNVVPPGSEPPALRTLSVRPSAGAVQRPVLAAVADDAEGQGPAPPAGEA